MSKTDTTFYMAKLLQMDKELGGTARAEQGAGASDDEFVTIKNVIEASMYELEKKMGERNDKIKSFGKSADTMRLDIEIKDKLQDIERSLGGMNEALRRQSKNTKKHTKQELENKEKTYSDLRARLKRLQQNDQTDKSSANSSFISGGGNYETITDMKSKLIGPRHEVRRDLNEEEKDAIEAYKEKDKQMDNMLDEINDGVLQWKDKAVKIGQKIDETSVKIDKLTKEVDKTTEQLETSNRRLKKIVDEYRKPNKFCMDIILIVILIGLVGVIIKVAKK